LNVLVLGGAGKIGSALAWDLAGDVYQKFLDSSGELGNK
jgi:nucleoside-diphosphate-sugar epimerase